MELTNIPTDDLVQELIIRNGVNHIEIEPYEKYTIESNEYGLQLTGPAVLLVIAD